MLARPIAQHMKPRRPPASKSTFPANFGFEPSHPNTSGDAEVRIIGGTLRGLKLRYLGDPRTRPMKDRVREALFNLLGDDLQGAFVLDLFAGTGALGFEALSRGAERCVFFEQHFPTARAIELSAERFQVAERCEVVPANTLVQFRRPAPFATDPLDRPWVVFCSPPYDFYVQRTEPMLQLIESLLERAPKARTLVVECDDRFAIEQLPQSDAWQVRDYPPARVAILR